MPRRKMPRGAQAQRRMVLASRSLTTTALTKIAPEITSVIKSGVLEAVPYDTERENEAMTLRLWTLLAITTISLGCGGTISSERGSCDPATARDASECQPGGDKPTCTGPSCGNDSQTISGTGGIGIAGTGGVSSNGCVYGDCGNDPKEVDGSCTGARPQGNTGVGFYVSGSSVYDANNCPFLPIGYNAAVFWNTTVNGERAAHDRAHLASIRHIADTGANTVRVVSQTAGAFGWNANTAMQRELVQRSIDSGLVPILEMHDATCDGDIAPIRRYWESSSMVQLALDYEDTMWINIANEHNFSSPEAWRDFYTDTIGSLRDLGVRNLIVLDSGARCGQDPQAIFSYGQDVLDADPQHNVVFSFHMYSFWVSLPCTTCNGWTPPFEVVDTFQRLADTGLPIYIGEFGWNNPSSMDVLYNPQQVIEEAEQHGFGWTFWAWYEDLAQYRVLQNLGDPNALSPAGEQMVPYVRSTAFKASIFR